MRTKGHAFRGTTSFRRALPRGALVTLTVLLAHARVESSIGSRYNGLTRVDLLCAVCEYGRAAHFFSSHAGRRSTVGTVGASSRWPSLLYQ